MENVNIQRLYKALYTDCHPSDQPKDTYRYALNAVTETRGGDTNFLSTEESNSIIAVLQEGTTIVGNVRMNDNNICIFAKLPNGMDYIGILSKNLVLVQHVLTFGLNFSVENPIYGTFRIRRNNERVVYWVDNENPPRYFNFDKPYDFYNSLYSLFLTQNTSGGTLPDDDNAFPIDQIWDNDKFNLIRSYDNIPEFINTEVIVGGSIPSGSYSAAIQLVDQNLNPTEWISVSDPVNIYVDPSTLNYSKIRGSRQTDVASQKVPNSNKSIRWTIANLDPSFSYYRIAVVQCNNGDGNINKVLVSSLISTSNDKFTYSGNDGDFTDTPISDIQVGKMDISSASHIEQLENRLILAGIKGKQINYCEFQKYASLITPYCVTEKIIIDDVQALGSPKNPLRNMTGYMPDEVYSFGIVYLHRDGTKSPVFHIPGVPQLPPEYEDPTNGMQYYECTNNNYIPLHSCLTEDYWGVDGFNGIGASLVNTPIRHHRFPKRTGSLYIDEVIDVIIGYQVSGQATIHYNNSQFLSDGIYMCVVHFAAGKAYYEAIASDGGAAGVSGLSFINGNGEFDIDLGDFPTGTVIRNLWLEWRSNNGNYDIPYEYETISVENTTNYHEDIIKSEKRTYVNSFGIQFKNIQRPHEDIIGYEIVRNERTDSDKCVIDNAIIGPLMNTAIDGEPPTDNPYHSFGLLCPDTDDTNFSTIGAYVFAPEHQFYRKQLSFDEINVYGAYVANESTGKFVGTSYTEDVRPGTTFNDKYEKGDDPDGFDLQVLFRANRFTYYEVTNVSMPDIDAIHHLSAAGSKILGNGDVFFNTSGDNKIIISEFTDLDPTIFTTSGERRLLMASLLKNNTNAYNNFINRTYYKEHVNPMYFTTDTVDSEPIFNGDSYVNPMTINSSTYWDTKFGEFDKKKQWWKTIVGGFLFIVGVALIATGLGTAVGVMAIGYGISLAASGVTFEIMKDMMDIDYKAGLKVTLEDNDNTDTAYPPSSTLDPPMDDRLCWFVDRLDNIYFESSINIGLRSGHSAPISDFVNSPSVELSDDYTLSNSATVDNYESYLLSKFTVIDRERSSGRLYTGFPIAELYDMNLDYLRKSKEKSYYYLPIEYDCCSETVETYPNRIFYSEQSFQEEALDNYRKFLPNNYKDIEGEFGRVTNLFKINNNLYIHTEEGLFYLPQNLQERVSQDLVSFIGTGDFFAIPQKKIAEYGSKHKQATVLTPVGTFYVSYNYKAVVLFTDKANFISGNGMNSWFTENIPFALVENLIAKGITFENDSNTLSPLGIGFTAGYDPRLKRVLLTKIDYVPVREYTLFTGYETEADHGKFMYDPVNHKFGWFVYSDTNPHVNQVPFTNTDYFENKSWTISYSLSMNSWISFHSYIPQKYIFSDSEIFSIKVNLANTIYKHNQKGKYLNFYGSYKPHIIDYVSVSSPIQERIWDGISVLSQALKMLPNGSSIPVNSFFTYLVAYNSRQCSGQLVIDAADNLDPEQLMLLKVQDSNVALIAERKEGIWNINDLRDLVDNYSESFFTSSWNIIKSSYPIDKVINPTVINVNKNWMDIESFRDKYLQLRLIFINFAANDDIQLTTNYSMESEQASIR